MELELEQEGIPTAIATAVAPNTDAMGGITQQSDASDSKGYDSL